jgi:hypothetical protein
MAATAAVEFDEYGTAHATLAGTAATNPIRKLHERTWARCVAPTEAELRDAYLAAGFPQAQLDRCLRRKARWAARPDYVTVRFSRPVGSVLQQSEATIMLDAVAEPKA